MRQQNQKLIYKNDENVKIENEKVHKKSLAIKIEQSYFKEYDNYSQFSQWIKKFKRLKRYKMLKENQVYQIVDFTQISQKIFFSKSEDANYLIFKCKNYDICNYQLIFLKSNDNTKFNYFQRNKKALKKHPKLEQCTMSEQQLLVVKMKKYLKLVEENFIQILQSPQIQFQKKNPTYIMNKFCQLYSKTDQFLYFNLSQQNRRHLKKHFDNYISTLKKQIIKKNQIGLKDNLQKKQQSQKAIKKHKSIKKRRKPIKNKISKISKFKNNKISIKFKQSQILKDQKIQQQENIISLTKNKKISQKYQNYDINQIYHSEDSQNIIQQLDSYHYNHKNSLNKQLSIQEIKQDQSSLIKQINQQLFKTPTKKKKQKCQFNLQNSNQKGSKGSSFLNQQKITKFGLQSIGRIQRELKFESEEQIQSKQQDLSIERIQPFKTEKKRKKSEYLEKSQVQGQNLEIFQYQQEKKIKSQIKNHNRMIYKNI